MSRVTILKQRCAVIALLGLFIPFNATALTLNVPQKYTDSGKYYWCWAAVSQAILEFYGTYKSQTQIAAYGTCGADIENYLYGGDSTRKGVDMILRKLGPVYSTGHPSPLEEFGVLTLINTYLSPIAIRWFSESGSHHVIIKGADRDSWHTLYLWFMDPKRGTYQKDYAWAVNGGGHTWTHSLTIDTKSMPEDMKRKLYSINKELSPSGKNIGNKMKIPSEIDWDGKHISKP